MTLAELCAHWRADAATLARRGCPDAARLLDSCADELAACLTAGQEDTLTLADAARESGYSVGHLRRLIAEGRLRDMAPTGRPRVRRGDLPRKPGYAPPSRLRPAA